jgi:hypothetical protein
MSDDDETMGNSEEGSQSGTALFIFTVCMSLCSALLLYWIIGEYHQYFSSTVRSFDLCEMYSSAFGLPEMQRSTLCGK